MLGSLARWSSLILSALQVFDLCGQSVHYRTGPVGSWVIEHDPDQHTVKDTACLQGGEEILLLDRQYDLGTEQIYWRHASKLSSSEGVQNGSRFETSFDPSFQQLTLHHLRILRNGQVIDKLNSADLRVLHREEDMNSFLYDGSLTVVCDMKDVRVGDVIDYAMTLKGWNPVDKGRFHRYIAMGYGVPAAHSYTRIIVPNGRHPRIERHSFDLQPEERTTASGKEIIWDIAPLECVQVDDNVPGWYNGYPAVDITEFNSVEELRNWALEQYTRTGELSGALRSRIEGFRDLPSEWDRIDSAVNLVQREVRYLGLEGGISSYRPHAPSMVYEQRFGDCKDKSFLLTTILDALGIKAYPALVNTSSGRTLDQWLPRPSLFDHCIAVVPLQRDTLWVDATSTHNGGKGRTRYTTDYGQALVVGRGFSGYTRMHVQDTGWVEVVEHVVLDTVGAGGDLRIEVTCRGRRADILRAELASQSIIDLGKGYMDFYAGIYGPCTEVEQLRYTDDISANVITTWEHYHIEQAWDTIHDEREIAFSTVAYYVRDHLVKPGKAVRTAPFALGEPLVVSHKLVIQLPERWSVTAEEDVHYEGSGISYSRSMKVEGYRVVTMDYRYTSTLPDVTAADAPALQALQERIADDLYYEYSLPLGGEVASSPIAWGKWFFILFCMAASAFGALRLYRYDPPPHAQALGKQPKAIGGFLILPAIGLCINPLGIVYDILSDDAALLHATDYTSLVRTDNALGVDLYMHLSQLMAFALFAFSILLIVLFFRRRSSIPLLMKLMYAGSAGWLLVDYGLFHALDLDTTSGMVYPTKDITRAILAACIWVPVFHLSTRVHSTFTCTLDPTIGRRNIEPPVPAAPDKISAPEQERRDS
ncbi:MAG: DUF3857 domain-containing protein [Flavobacteriales bacterium]|nr:DUF3857 domain-containing protein [Flavobacteriales bacterium]